MRKLMVLFMMLVCLPHLSWGAALNPAPGIGEAVALSGAFNAVGGPDSACTHYYNPCGILDLNDPLDRKLHINLNADIILPQYDIRKSGFKRSKKSKAGSFYLLPLLGVSKRLSDDVAIGLGVYTPYGLGATYERELGKGFFKSDTMLSLTNLSPTVAFKLTNHLVAGVSLNIGYGQFKYNSPFDIKGRPLPIPTKNTADGFGIGTTLSLRWQPNDKFSWALTATSPMTVKFKEGKSVINLGLLKIRDNFDTEFTFPAKIGTGIAWRFTDRWTVSTDYNYFFYSGAVGTMALEFDKLPMVKKSDMDWVSIFSAHLGFKFQQTDKLDWTFGVGYQPAAIPDETISQLTPDVPGWSVSAGVDYEAKKVDLETYVGYAWGNRKVSRDFNHREPGEYKVGVWRIGIKIGF